MKPFLHTLSLLLLLMPGFAHAAAADAILGMWTTAEEKSRVEIYKKDDTYHGRIIALKEPLHPADPDHQDFVAGREGQPKHDRRNPEEKLRDRPIVGMDLMTGFRHDGDDTWSGGTIYDPESGKTYRCKLTLAAPNELKVRGFIGVALLGRTTVWTR